MNLARSLDYINSYNHYKAISRGPSFHFLFPYIIYILYHMIFCICCVNYALIKNVIDNFIMLKYSLRNLLHKLVASLLSSPREQVFEASEVFIPVLFPVIDVPIFVLALVLGSNRSR